MYILEWYKRCPVCDARGVSIHSDTNDYAAYYCMSCSFNWESEYQCDYHTQDGEHGDLCNRDSSIGECKGSLCPRLKEVSLRYRGFGEQQEIDYPKGYVKVPSDISS